jgi:hypothetical protein
MTLRWLITVLIALALPVQGLAAVANWHCSGARYQAVSVEARALSSASLMAGDAHEACPHASMVKEPHRSTSSAQANSMALMKVLGDLAVDVSGDFATDPAQGCSACAACCIGLALPPVVMPTLEAPSSDAFDAKDASMVASFVADGVERPPRPLFA